jgi:hypothetical protein
MDKQNFETKIIHKLFEIQKEKPEFDRKVVDVNFRMFIGYHDKIALPPKNINEGEYYTSEIIFRLIDNGQIIIPMYSETTFLQTRHFKKRSSYYKKDMYIVGCFQPSKFHLKLKKLLLEKLKYYYG